MSTPWLHIIGVPEEGVEALGGQLLTLIEQADAVIGVARRLEGVARRDGQELVPWDGNLKQMVARIMDYEGRQTVLFASGDPNWFGIGATLARHLPVEQFEMHPCPSSFQLAAARMHWPLQNVATVSLHGRPAAKLHPHILPGNRVLALTSDATTLHEVAGILIARGYGHSQLATLENLGAPDEKTSVFQAIAASDHSVGDFYVLAIDCVADEGAELLPLIPGLPDEVFVSDGQLTKREVRAATLAKLAPYPGALLWDVGAGSGSVGIEFMRAAHEARAICFEREAERLEMIAKNRLALGVPDLKSVEGEAPESLEGAETPDAIFIGGDAGNEALFDACWTALRPGGRLVANAVTIEGEQALYARHAALGGELARLDISVLDHVGPYRALRPRMAVTQWLVTKDQTK